MVVFDRNDRFWIHWQLWFIMVDCVKYVTLVMMVVGFDGFVC